MSASLRTVSISFLTILPTGMPVQSPTTEATALTVDGRQDEWSVALKLRELALQSLENLDQRRAPICPGARLPAARRARSGEDSIGTRAFSEAHRASSPVSRVRSASSLRRRGRLTLDRVPSGGLLAADDAQLDLQGLDAAAVVLDLGAGTSVLTDGDAGAGSCSSKGAH